MKFLKFLFYPPMIAAAIAATIAIGVIVLLRAIAERDE